MIDLFAPVESSSTDPVSVEELEEEEDQTELPSLPTTPADELGKTPDRVRKGQTGLTTYCESPKRFNSMIPLCNHAFCSRGSKKKI